MLHATRSQPPTHLGDIRCCGRGIRLPDVPRADCVVYVWTDADRTRL